MDRSPNLDMPFLMPAQAQKHVTHNEALERLDAIVQLTVLAFEATSPPSAPADGDCYALANGATGVWAGQERTLAVWATNHWEFVAPKEGWRAFGKQAETFRVFNGSDWVVPDMPFTKLGINSAADTQNRLTVAADATLLSHDGNDHQLKINKAADGDTATLLFQSSWTGFAEIGLAGNTDWSIKVSPDGNSWTEALTFDAGSGLASGAAIQSSTSDFAPGKLMRTEFGYGPGNILGTVSVAGGVPDGAVIENGTGPDGDYVKFADGTMICWHGFDDTDVVAWDVATGPLFVRATTYNWDYPMPFSAPPTVTTMVESASKTADGCKINQVFASYARVRPWSSELRSVSTFKKAAMLAIGRWN